MSDESIEIPWRELSEEALEGLMEAFVMREGTDYGAREASFAEKVDDVRAQLRDGRARILYDPASESINLVTAEMLARSAD